MTCCCKRLKLIWKLYLFVYLLIYFFKSYICTQQFKHIDSQSKLNVHDMEHVETQDMKWDILGKIMKFPDVSVGIKTWLYSGM